MANKFTYQTLRDTNTEVIIKLTGTFDGSGQEANNTRITANSFSGAIATNGYLVANSQGGSANTTLSYYDLQLTGLKYYVNLPATSPLKPTISAKCPVCSFKGVSLSTFKISSPVVSISALIRKLGELKSGISA